MIGTEIEPSGAKEKGKATNDMEEKLLIGDENKWILLEYPHPDDLGKRWLEDFCAWYISC